MDELGYRTACSIMLLLQIFMVSSWITSAFLSFAPKSHDLGLFTDVRLVLVQRMEKMFKRGWQ